MEAVEMDEEPEKMYANAKRRRSSILKLPKNRSPFGEVDLADTCSETTLSKTTRRVSFASSNLVKPFVADPDKNTIWDTTYEEEINHTDSTQSSQEHSNKVNSTLFSSLRAPVNVMSVSAVDMDITKGALLIDKENIPQLPRISIVDYAKKISTNSFVPLYSLPSHNQSLFQTETMEFTCQNLNPLVTLNGAEADVSEMELTEIAGIPCEEVTNKSFHEKDFICQMAMSKPEALTADDSCEDIGIQVIGSYPNGELLTPEKSSSGTCQDNEASKTNKSGSGDMEFTCRIPWKACDELSKSKKSCNNMEFTCQSVEVPKAEKSISMELTCEVTSLSTKCQSKEVSKVEKSFADNMDFTCRLPTEVSQSKKFNNCDMEFTRQLETKYRSTGVSKSEKSECADLGQTYCDTSKIEKSFASNMEFTCQLPSVCQNKKVSKFDKGDCDKITINDMEFTCQLPTQIQNSEMCMSNYEECHTRPATDLENEGYCQLPTESQNHEMEFTCQIPTTELATKADRSKSRMEKSCLDMDFTCQLPPVCQLNDVSNLGKSATCNMELKCQILPADLEKVSRVPETDESISVEMDFTCQIPKQKSHVDIMEFSQCQDELLKTKNEEISNHISSLSQSAVINENNSYQNQSCQIPTREVITVSENGCQMSNFNNKQSGLEETPFISNQIDYPIGNKAAVAVKTPLKPSKLPVRSPVIRENAEVISKDESALNLTCASPTIDKYSPKGIVYSQKIPPNLKLFPSKHSFSGLKTPDPSFLINLTNISCGVDDTQHLLHRTYTKPLPEWLIASKCESQERICTAAQEIGNVSVPRVSSLSHIFNDLEIDEARNYSGSQDTTLIDTEKNKLTTVNDTYVLARKSALKSRTIESGDELNVNTYIVNNKEVEDNDTSLGLMDEEQMVVPDVFDGREIEDEEMNLQKIERIRENDVEMFSSENRTEIKLKEFKFTIKRVEEMSHVIERIEKRRKLITDLLENFKLKEIRVPQEFVIAEKSSSDESDLSVEKCIKTAEDVHPTLIEKIRKRQESSQNAWQLERVDGVFYHFSTLFGTLIFVVELNPEKGTVRNMRRSRNLKDDVDSRALYIMKLFCDKLGSIHVKASIGEHFDVLSLLDYVEMIMVKLMRLQEDLMNCDNLTITRDYIAKFRIISVPLTLICEILVDVSDLENVNVDDVKVCPERGTVDEKELKKFVKECPKGYRFINEFARCVDEYFTTKEKRKKFKRNL